MTSLSAAPGGLPIEAWVDGDLSALLEMFDCIEVKNGLLARPHNELAARVVQAMPKARRLGVTAGSAAQGSSRVGRTVTVSGARTAREFLDDLRAGRTWAGGADGTIWTTIRAQGLRGAWTGARVRGTRKRLDRLDRRRFQERVRTFEPGLVQDGTTVHDPGERPAAHEQSIEPPGSP